MNEKYIKYVVGFNQIGVFRYGLHNYVDLFDLVILDYLNQMWIDEKKLKTKKFNDNEKYLWLNYNHLSKSMPCLKLKKAAISIRMRKLRDLELIHLKKEKDNTMYFRLTDYFYKIWYYKEKGEEKDDTIYDDKKGVFMMINSPIYDDKYNKNINNKNNSNKNNSNKNNSNKNNKTFSSKNEEKVVKRKNNKSLTSYLIKFLDNNNNDFKNNFDDFGETFFDGKKSSSKQKKPNRINDAIDRWKNVLKQLNNGKFPNSHFNKTWRSRCGKAIKEFYNQEDSIEEADEKLNAMFEWLLLPEKENGADQFVKNVVDYFSTLIKFSSQMTGYWEAKRKQEEFEAKEREWERQNKKSKELSEKALQERLKREKEEKNRTVV